MNEIEFNKKDHKSWNSKRKNHLIIYAKKGEYKKQKVCFKI
tara:strand:+ start:853 stop:975 length:123 start_codon:yes stop_codon:yes gene_type:complete